MLDTIRTQPLTILGRFPQGLSINDTPSLNLLEQGQSPPGGGGGGGGATKNHFKYRFLWPTSELFEKIEVAYPLSGIERLSGPPPKQN